MGHELILHEKRFEICEELRALPVQTGDIFFRLGNETFAGLPFSRLVAKVTKSDFAHAAVAFFRPIDPFPRLVEVNAGGVQEVRLTDWLDYCWSPRIAIYRPVESVFDSEVERQKWQERLLRIINFFLDEDPDYDFSFDPDRSKFYCTEAVEFLYNESNFPNRDLCVLYRPKDLMSWFDYNILFKPGNWFMRKLFKRGMSLDLDTVFVGNRERGLMSSPYLHEVLNKDFLVK